jgi:hypothetical protein
MTHDQAAGPHDGLHDDPLLAIDPWVALMDGRSQLLRAIDGLDAAGAARAAHADADADPDAETDAWTVGDLLTHLAAWDELHTRLFRALAEGGTAGPALPPDTDRATWNAARVAESRGDALAARVERLHAARAALIEAAAALEGERFDARVATPWGVDDSPRAALVAQAMHDGMHAETIVAALRSANGHASAG